MITSLGLLAVVLLGSGCPRETSRKSDSTAGSQTPGSETQSLEAQRIHTFLARGENFKWHFFTAGEDGELMTEDDLFVGHELTLPPRSPVELTLTSVDYVYTLTSPDGEKEIAVPEMIHTLNFVAPDSGTYEFRTDPMCGLRFFHDDVQGKLLVEASALRVTVDAGDEP